MEDLCVEVKGDNGAYYKAFLTDVTDTEIVVAFENDWQPERRFTFARSRLPPVQEANSPTTYSEGQEIEVFSRVNEQEDFGWWKATVKMIRGDSFLVEHIGWEVGYTETAHNRRIRPPNPNPPLNKNIFVKFEIQVPEDLRQYANQEGVHDEFQRSIGAAICRFVPESGDLVCISRVDGSKGLAVKLKDLHFRNLSQKVLLPRRTEEVAIQLESTRISSSAGEACPESSSIENPTCECCPRITQPGTGTSLPFLESAEKRLKEDLLDDDEDVLDMTKTRFVPPIFEVGAQKTESYQAEYEVFYALKELEKE